MSDLLTPDDPNVVTQPLQLIQTAFEQLGADTSMPNVYHAVVCTQKSLQYEWRRILRADEVCSGAYTWPNGEAIQYCYFVPGVRTESLQNSSRDQAKLEAANKVVTRVGELGEKALALVSTLGTVWGVNVTGLFTREDWLHLLYSFAWKYPGPSLSAERYRIFRPSNERPLTTDPTYRESDYDVHVSVQHPSAMEHETAPITLEHEGRIWTESFPEAFSHSYFAALTPDICAASARVIAAILRPAARQPSHREEVTIKPIWDGCQLEYNGVVLKVYKKHPARNQRMLLNAFQTAGWPATIQNPWHDPKQKDQSVPLRTLNETLRAINDTIASVGRKSEIPWK